MALKDILTQRRLEQQQKVVSAADTEPKETNEVYHTTWAPEELKGFYSLFEGIEDF